MVRDWTRRQLISRLGGVAVLGALAGCPGTDGPETPPGPPTTETPAAQEYQNVVDIVEAGADPDGSSSILPTLREIDTDDTLVRFPPGEYYMEEGWEVDEFERLGVVGPEATITTTTDYTGPLFGLGTGDRLYVDGLSFDFTDDDTGPRPINAKASTELVVSNVSVSGEMDIDQDGPRFDVTDEDGTGAIRQLRLPDGGSPEYSNTGCYVGENHSGFLVFENCLIDGFPDNGLYASPAVGRIDVVGGQYHNSGVANVRVSGPSTIRDVTVRCNEARDGVENMRGIRLRAGSNILVENCRVVMDRVTESDGAITCANGLESATIRDTHVTVGADNVPAFLAKPQQGAFTRQSRFPIQVRNLTVDGQAADGAAVHIIERAGTLLDGLCVCQVGENRDGVAVYDSTGTALRRASITVTGEPLVTEGSSIRRTDLSLQSTADGNPGIGGSSCNCS